VQSPSPRSVSTPRFRDTSADVLSLAGDEVSSSDQGDEHFVQMHAPLEEVSQLACWGSDPWLAALTLHAFVLRAQFERNGTRGMDSTHTQRARDMDPSKMDAQQSPVDPMKTVRLLVGHYAAEQLTLDAGPPTEWTLSVVPAPAQDEDEKVTLPGPL